MRSTLRRRACLGLAALAASLALGCPADKRVDDLECRSDELLYVLEPSIVRVAGGTMFATAKTNCVPSLLVPDQCGINVEPLQSGEVLGRYYLRDDGANGDAMANDDLYSALVPDDGRADSATFWIGPCPAPPVTVLVE